MRRWPYKTNRDFYLSRDRALIALLILTGCRISEALRLKRLQFRIYDDRIELRNVSTLKSGNMRNKITLPKAGRLEDFSLTVEKWLRLVPSEDSYVFPQGSNFGLNWKKHIGRKRGYAIVRYITGKFPHYYRAICETIYARLVFKGGEAWKLQQFMGLKRLDSTTPYVQSSWEEDEHKIFKL